MTNDSKEDKKPADSQPKKPKKVFETRPLHQRLSTAVPVVGGAIEKIIKPKE